MFPLKSVFPNKTGWEAEVNNLLSSASKVFIEFHVSFFIAAVSDEFHFSQNGIYG